MKIAVPRPARWTAAVLAALTLLYALAGFLLAPYLIQRYLPSWLGQRLHGRAEVGAVHVNPFLLELDLRDVKLAAPDGTPLVGAARVFADLQWSTLFRRAWVFDEALVDGLDARLVLERDGRLNLARLFEEPGTDRRAEPPPAQRGGDRSLPPLLLRHAAVTHGSVSFTDRTLPQAVPAAVTALDVEVYDLSTRRDDAGRYTVDAQFAQGGTLAWQGELELRPLASQGTLEIRGLRGGTLWAVVHGRNQLAPPQGTLDFKGSYQYTYEGGAHRIVLDPFELHGSQIVLRSVHAQQPSMTFDRIDLRDGHLDLAARVLDVPVVNVRGGRVVAKMDQNGVFDLQQLFAAPPGADGSAQPAGSADIPPWHVTLRKVQLANIAVDYTDQARAEPVHVGVGAVSGALGVSATTGAAQADTVVRDVGLRLARIDVARPGSGMPIARVESAAVAGGKLDTGARALAAERIEVTGAALTLVRDESGRVQLPGMSGTGTPLNQPAGAERIRGAAGPGPTGGSARWKYNLATLDASRIDLTLSDRSAKPAADLSARLERGSLKNIDSEGQSPMPFDAKLRFGAGGELDANGNLALAGPRADGRLKLASLSLAPLQPLLARYATLELRSGTLSGNASVRYAGTSGLAVRGALVVDDLRVDEMPARKQILAWKRMSADSVAFARNRLRVAEIVLQQPQTQLIIGKDRKLHLNSLLKPRPAQPVRQAAGTRRSQPAGDRFSARIDRVTVRDGVLDYADLSLVLPFSTRIVGIVGGLADISTDPKSRATVRTEGRIEPAGSARARGGINLFHPVEFTDIHAEFNNVLMPELSPYTATFAGRKVASGRLWLDVHYKIDNAQLAGSNKIVLDDFTLGERVDSPSALNLPLDLAVALLKDERGRINVAVPVEGDLNNPHFDYATVIRKALANLVTRVVTAPFRFLGHLLGKDGGEQLAAVRFEPGRASLRPEQAENLRTIAEALKKRPQLALVVLGPYDPQQDGAALRRQQVRLELNRSLGREEDASEAAGPIAFGDAHVQRALEQMLETRQGKDAVARFRAEFERQAGRKASLVNPVLGALGKGSEDYEFYRSLFRRLVEIYPLPDAAIRRLAEARGRAIVDYLARNAGVDPARVRLGGVQAVKGGDKEEQIAAGLKLQAAGAA